MRDFVLQALHMLLHELNGSVLSAIRDVAADIQTERLELLKLRELLLDHLEEPIGLVVGDVAVSPRGTSWAETAPSLALTPMPLGVVARVRYRRPDGKERVEAVEFYRPMLLVSYGARILCAVTSNDIEAIHRQFDRATATVTG